MKRPLLFGIGLAAGAAAVAMRRVRPKVDLRDHVVLITGGSRGLGLGLAREFASRGAHLVLCARDRGELDRARSDLANSRARVVSVVCDVTNRDQVKEAIERARNEFGRIDILVNNAGVISVGPIHEMTVADFEEAMNVMFWGIVYTTLETLPEFRKRGSGSIVNITSIGGKVSVPHLVPYSCAKFAAVAFSEGLSAELRGTGVNVVTIAPGLMRTGSYLNARFKGHAQAEAAWFSASASLPGVSMSAARAARQIVEAIEQGRTERILSTPANLLARFHGMFPEVSAAVLGIVNRLLPSAGHEVAVGTESPVLERPWMRAITILGRKAAEEYLQPAHR